LGDLPNHITGYLVKAKRPQIGIKTAANTLNVAKASKVRLAAEIPNYGLLP
jgi:hypothetical protein